MGFNCAVNEYLCGYCPNRYNGGVNRVATANAISETVGHIITSQTTDVVMTAQERADRQNSGGMAKVDAGQVADAAILILGGICDQQDYIEALQRSK